MSAELLKETTSRRTTRCTLWLLVLGAVVMVGMIAAERGMGRIPLSKSGRLLLWVWETDGPETSQQVLDWYSITHVEHGFVLYGMVWVVWRMTGRASEGAGVQGKGGSAAWTGASFAAVLLAEAAWEVLENSPVIIDRYRAQTAAAGYMGDTILNSVTDVASCMLGWWLARRLPWWGTLGVFVVVEAGLLMAIRDNFVLNVLMLTWPVEAIKQWQQGA